MQTQHKRAGTLRLEPRPPAAQSQFPPPDHTTPQGRETFYLLPNR